MTAVMTSADQSEPAARDLVSVAEFRGWLARAASCSWFEYHRGLLLWDRLSDAGGTASHRICSSGFTLFEG